VAAKPPEGKIKTSGRQGSRPSGRVPRHATAALAGARRKAAPPAAKKAVTAPAPEVARDAEEAADSFTMSESDLD
jgi:hypothetical protein